MSEEELTEIGMKTYRKYIGKLNWLASNTRPDLLVFVMEIARKQKRATLKDLRNINRVLVRLRKRRIELCLEEFQIINNN